MPVSGSVGNDFYVNDDNAPVQARDHVLLEILTLEVSAQGVRLKLSLFLTPELRTITSELHDQTRAEDNPNDVFQNAACPAGRVGARPSGGGGSSKAHEGRMLGTQTMATAWTRSTTSTKPRQLRDPGGKREGELDC